MNKLVEWACVVIAGAILVLVYGVVPFEVFAIYKILHAVFVWQGWEHLFAWVGAALLYPCVLFVVLNLFLDAMMKEGIFR